MLNKKELNSLTKNSLKSKGGFTLLEILMVVALLGMLVAYVGRKVFSSFAGGKRKITVLYMDGIKGSLDQYKLDCNDYPKSLDALITNPGDCPQYAVEGYNNGKKTLDKDPYNCPLFYKYEGGVMELKSLGSDCKEGGEGEATDIPARE
jgi:general secretion pathway protein G